MDLEQLHRIVHGALAPDPNVVAVYLFGSRARGTARAESDVDLGVLYRTAPSPTLLGQPFEVQAQLSAQRMTDEALIERKRVDPRIVRDVVENHLGDQAAFVAAVRSRMTDVAPHR